MPPLTRPEGVPIGQLGRVQQVHPRADDAGIGGILRQAAAMEFGAGAQRAATGVDMAQLGAAHTEAGLELLKPFKKIRDSREVIMADDIGIKAQLSLRADTDAMQTSGSDPATWGEQFQQTFTKTSTAALTLARKYSPAAEERVYKTLQEEYLNLFTKLTVGAVKADGATQLGALAAKESFSLKSAVAARDPAVRTGHADSYRKSLELAVFNRLISPAEGQQKLEHFNNQLRDESAVQMSLDKGLLPAFTAIDNLNMLPTERTALKNKVEAALKDKVDAQKATDKAIEKQRKLDQTVQYTTFRSRILVETNPQTLLMLIHKIPEFIKTGALEDAEGKQLIGDTEARLKDLAKPNPEETIPAIEDNLRYRIAVNAKSVTEPEIRDTRGLSSNTRTQLYDMKRGYESTQHYSHLETYKGVIRLLRSYSHGPRDSIEAVLNPETAESDLSQRVARTVNMYVAQVNELSTRLGRRLTEADLATLDPQVRDYIQRLESTVYVEPAANETLESLTQPAR